jgi:hypothetical protein
MKTVKYKIFRRDDSTTFGPFVLGDKVPLITGDLEYLLCTSVQDTVNSQELYEGDKVSFSSDEGIGGSGVIVWGARGFTIKTTNNGCLLSSCRFLQRLGSIYDKQEGV